MNKTNILFDDIITILPRNISELQPNISGIDIKVENRNGSSLSDQLLNHACTKKTWFEKKGTKGRMNVLLIQIDSMSFNHFRRMFPETFEFLSTSLKDNKVYENFMVVGEKTKPNTFPWLGNVAPYGIPELGIPNEDSLYKNDYSNDFPFIWKDFQKLGYITMYNEDFLIKGLFFIF
jgi:hypothetical protein